VKHGLVSKNFSKKYEIRFVIFGEKLNFVKNNTTKITSVPVIFKNEQFGEIRTMVGENGEPWFVGKDVAMVLGYKNSRDALYRHVDDDDKLDSVAFHDAIGRERNTTIINESGLYSLILSSKLPQAKDFKRWVTSVVLPQIRKTGGYINVTADDDDKTVMAKALMIAHKTIELKDQLLEAQKPMVKFAKAVVGCDDSILIRDLAKLITQNGVHDKSLLLVALLQVATIGFGDFEGNLQRKGITHLLINIRCNCSCNCN